MTSSTFNTLLRQRVKDTNTNNQFFTDTEITNARDRAIKWLYPRVWDDTYVDVTITESNKLQIDMASTIARLMDIKVYDTSNNFEGTYNSFYRIGSKLFPLSEFPVGKVFRLIVAKKFITVEELGDEFEDLLLDRSQMELLKTMEHDRSKYYKYTTTVRPEGGNLPSLGQMLRTLRDSTLLRRSELAQVPESTFINLTER